MNRRHPLWPTGKTFDTAHITIEKTDWKPSEIGTSDQFNDPHQPLMIASENALPATR